MPRAAASGSLVSGGSAEASSRTIVCKRSAQKLRVSAGSRSFWAERLQTIVRELASALPPETKDPEAAALGIYATMIGALQLSRAVNGTELSDRILAAGADVARAVTPSAAKRFPGNH